MTMQAQQCERPGRPLAGARSGHGPRLVPDRGMGADMGSPLGTARRVEGPCGQSCHVPVRRHCCETMSFSSRWTSIVGGLAPALAGLLHTVPRAETSGGLAMPVVGPFGSRRRGCGVRPLSVRLGLRRRCLRCHRWPATSSGRKRSGHVVGPRGRFGASRCRWSCGPHRSGGHFR
jgi:hypothetical protein